MREQTRRRIIRPLSAAKPSVVSAKDGQNLRFGLAFFRELRNMVE